MENNTDAPKKLKIELPYDPAGCVSEEKININLKRCINPNVHSSIIYNQQDMKAT